MKEKIKLFSESFNPLFITEVNRILTEQIHFSQRELPFEEFLATSIRNYSNDGKRIRPFLIYLFSEQDLSTLQDTNSVFFHACMASELFHVAALVHDDIMDQADTRRGVATIHTAIDSYKQHDEFLGKNIAILVGDMFIVAALQHAQKVSSQFFAEFSEMIQRTTRGQMLDIASINKGLGQVHLDEMHVRHILKTAWYTFGTPGRLGFQMNPGFELSSLPVLTEILIELGLLFQVRDDIIDCIDEKSGKPLFSDIREGQTTWVTFFLKDHAPELYEEILKGTWTAEKLSAAFQKLPLRESYEQEYNKVSQSISEQSEISTDTKTLLLELLGLLKLS
jgi:geranylgeranyl diphosphate synthase, type I